jgi:hypothetical protein
MTPWKANSCSDSEEIPGILRNLKVHYSIHKWPLLPPEPDESSLYAHPVPLRSILMLSCHLHLGSLSFRLPYQNCIFPVFPCMLHDLHILFPWFFHPNHIWQEVSFMKLLFMQFSSVYFTSILLGQNVLLSTLFLMAVYILPLIWETKYLCIYFWTKLLASNMGSAFLYSIHIIPPPKLTSVITSTWWEGLVLPMMPRAMLAGA